METGARDTPDEVKLANKLRLAVHRGGGSIDPEKNYELKAQLSPLLLPYSQVQRILKECELNERNHSTYSLPMDYGRQLVAMICKVRTDNLSDLKLRLANFLKQGKARFFNRHLFTETGLIEATLPSKLSFSFDDFNQTLRTDALWCKATDSAIVDLGKGNVLFKCRPYDLREVTEKLQQCKYKITHTEVGHCPNKLVNLTDRQMTRYQEFRKNLLQDEDVVKIYDNVRAQ
ncbi:probable transcriptional regulatory protein MHP7448_0474 isoform X2 [Drosophila ficusphila]|uniref:probable transcriptional regulatory protein MHP7448_0474 isoform X2 n=1 Tax=Drosophila ficusphila TaxID=30025 RepID=UPI0007E70287|nr:probable transcriptional regulatory protein MHP7448_0474 isoform X2 [Drosophila ficusphila]